MSGVGAVVGYMVSLWTFFQLVGGEVIGSQQHQRSSSNWPVGYVLVGSIWLTSSTWWGFQGLKNCSKDMAWNIGRTKGLCLCLMAKVLLFCLA